VAVAGRIVAEQVLEPVAALLHPDERQPELDDRVADDVIRRLVDQVDQDGAAVDGDPEAARREPLGERLAAVLDLDRERPGPLGEGAERRRSSSGRWRSCRP
jgi:hypothetical protein